MKLEEQRRGSSRVLGTSFIGTGLWGCVLLLWGTSQCHAFKFLTEVTGLHIQEDRLWIADPKAINHILQKSGYLYAKPSNARERIALLGDGGVASVEGGLPLITCPPLIPDRLMTPQATYTDVTGGQWLRRLVSSRRRVCYRISWILLPRYGSLGLYSILNADSDPCHQMADKWSSIIENGKPGYSAIIDVNVWFGKATLDACVLSLALGFHRLRANHEPTSRGDRCWSLRI